MLQCRDHAISPTPSLAWQTQLPTQRDPTTKQFILGKATDLSAGKAEEEPANTDEWGNQIEARQPAQTDNTGSATELAVKGDTRYLVQKMEGGTTCDLTRKPRRVEVQYHCNPHVTDRIGYIKEVIICSYLMVVYTPRLCNDIAFQPPKENKAHEIICRVIVSEEELSYLSELQMLEDELAAADESVEEKLPIIVGGVVLGGGKFHSSEGQRMPIPPNLDKDSATGRKSIEIIARGKSKAEGGKVEIASTEKLEKLDLDSAMVEQLKKDVQKMAKDKGWKIEVVDEPGHVREILGIVDGDDEDEDEEDGYVDINELDDLVKGEEKGKGKEKGKG